MPICRTREKSCAQAARKIGCGVVGTGKTDYASDGERLFSIANGHPLMTRVTGMGCVATSIVAAFLGRAANPFGCRGPRHGVYRYCRGMGGGTMRETEGAGTFRVKFLDSFDRLELGRFGESKRSGNSKLSEAKR